jgi:uncharacterized protein (UPF0276 family)
VTVRVGLSLMPEPAFATATLPLFADGLVDCVEWSVDMGWGPQGTPEWLDGLLDDYAEAGALDAHGVSFSLLSHHPRQEAWLERLKDELGRRPYRRVSEHLGWMAAGPVRRSSPLPLPPTPSVVALGTRQAERVAEVVGAPLGLENLATALSAEDRQSQLCRELLDATDGWLVLDLHNLWCQAVNLGLDATALLLDYPLERVREVHVSGGSWWMHDESGRTIRRDTHDGPVPQPVLDLLPLALERCVGLDTVIVEQLGTCLGDPLVDQQLRDDVLKVRELCGRPL